LQIVISCNFKYLASSFVVMISGIVISFIFSFFPAQRDMQNNVLFMLPVVADRKQGIRPEHFVNHPAFH